MRLLKFVQTRIDLWLGFNNSTFPKSVIKRLIKNMDMPIVIDVGCNIGEFTEFIYKINKNSKVFAFDLLPELTELLKLKFQIYDFDFREIGISDKKSFAFKVQRKNFDRKTYLSNKGKGKYKIKIDTLDNQLRNKVKKIDILKIDTEGNDLNVLKGANKIIKNTNIIIFEIMFRLLMNNQTPNDILNYLRSQGFRHFYRTSKYFGLIPINSIDPWEVKTHNLIASRSSLRKLSW